MDLNHESSASIWFNTYVKIRRISCQKRLYRVFIVKRYDENYYRVVMESLLYFVTLLIKDWILTYLSCIVVSKSKHRNITWHGWDTKCCHGWDEGVEIAIVEWHTN